MDVSIFEFSLITPVSSIAVLLLLLLILVASDVSGLGLDRDKATTRGEPQHLHTFCTSQTGKQAYGLLLGAIRWLS